MLSGWWLVCLGNMSYSNVKVHLMCFHYWFFLFAWFAQSHTATFFCSRTRHTIGTGECIQSAPLKSNMDQTCHIKKECPSSKASFFGIRGFSSHYLWMIVQCFGQVFFPP